MKQILSGFFAVIFIFSISAAAFAFPMTDDVAPEAIRTLSPPIWMPDDALVDNENIPLALDENMKKENEMGFCEQQGNKLKFTNLIDGYSVVIPADMQVDMSRSDVCTVFTDQHRRLSVFKETFSTASERLSYLNYSNKFIENTADHKLEKDESYTVGDNEYHILQWSRNRLARVENDKNYYACIDVCIGGRVYTFFFTADTPFASCGGYMDIVTSLLTFDPAVPKTNAYNKGYKKAASSRMNTAAMSAYNLLFSDDAKFSLGMFSPDKFGGFDKMEEFERKLDYEFSTFLIYTEFTDRTSPAAKNYPEKISSYFRKIEKDFEYARKTGKVIELTLQIPLTRAVEGSMIYEILDGTYDQFISGYSSLIAKYPDVAVLFRPFNEMNGDWCTYSSFHTSRDPQIYVELYRYLHKKFDQAGCSNTIWVWNPNEISFPNYKWNHQDLYYPGDEYVDVYGITGYNTGTYYESEMWRTFDEIYAPIYERAEKINDKPMMITEFSCSSVGGDKVKWLEEMFAVLPKYDKIKLGIWWHAADYNGEVMTRPYFMDTPEGMLEVFRKYLNEEATQ